MRNSSSGSLVSGWGDVALCGLFLALSLLAGILVVTVLLVATSPVVSMFPPDSGAQEIVFGIAMMWGVVTGCVAVVFTIGPYRRMHIGTPVESFDAAESVPLEMIGRPIARRTAANDRRPRAAAAAYAADDADDALLLEEEAAAPRRRAGRAIAQPNQTVLINGSGYSFAATTSTSINASGRARAEITKSVEAGASLPRNWARTSR